MGASCFEISRRPLLRADLGHRASGAKTFREKLLLHHLCAEGSNPKCSTSNYKTVAAEVFVTFGLAESQLTEIVA